MFTVANLVFPEVSLVYNLGERKNETTIGQIKKMAEILIKIWFIYNQIYAINITEMASSKHEQVGQTLLQFYSQDSDDH